MPEVSVLLSVYNGENFLAKAMQSVLDQTFENFEFIIINDGSEDNTALIIEQFSKKDKRIYFHNKEHTGLATSLNIGLTLSNSPIIARIDADDIWKPTKLEKQLKFQKDHSEIALLGCSVEYINEKGSRLRREGFNNNTYFDSKRIKTTLYRQNLFCHSSVLFNAGIVKDIGGYSERLMSSLDFDLWVRIVSQHDARIMSEQLVHYRIWEGMISMKKAKLQIRESILIRKKAFEKLDISRYKKIFLIWDRLVLWFRYFIHWSKTYISFLCSTQPIFNDRKISF